MKIQDEIKQYKFRSEEQKTSLNLLFTSAWLNQKLADIFKQEKVTKQQYNILRILRGQQGEAISIKEIRERMLDKMSDVSRIVEKLRKKGFLQRKENKDDRRNVDVIITPKGLDVLDALDEKVDAMDDHFKRLEPVELSQLNDLLDKLRG